MRKALPKSWLRSSASSPTMGQLVPCCSTWGTSSPRRNTRRSKRSRANLTARRNPPPRPAIRSMLRLHPTPHHSPPHPTYSPTPHPLHPYMGERLRQPVPTHAQVTGLRGTRERPLKHTEGGSDQDRSFDIAASLDALDALDRQASAGQPTFNQPTEQIDVEEVFAKFKAGVRAQVSETDSATHYDLGLAYREMGLFDDAIDEFEVAARDPKRECVCQSMIGMIQRNKGNTNAGIDAFIKGLHAEIKTGEQELSLYYELGDAYEAKGNGQEALYYFRKVAHQSPNHDDPRGTVAVRIRNVQALGGHRPAMERAVGASDEFDAAFDAAIGTDGKS